MLRYDGFVWLYNNDDAGSLFTFYDEDDLSSQLQNIFVHSWGSVLKSLRNRFDVRIYGHSNLVSWVNASDFLGIRSLLIIYVINFMISVHSHKRQNRTLSGTVIRNRPCLWYTVYPLCTQMSKIMQTSFISNLFTSMSQLFFLLSVT